MRQFKPKQITPEEKEVIKSFQLLGIWGMRLATYAAVNRIDKEVVLQKFADAGYYDLKTKKLTADGVRLTTNADKEALKAVDAKIEQRSFMIDLKLKGLAAELHSKCETQGTLVDFKKFKTMGYKITVKGKAAIAEVKEAIEEGVVID